MCSRKLLRENDDVMRPNYRSMTTFCTASVNNVMTFSAYISDRNIFYKQFNFGLAPQTFGLVTSSNSLPEGQPHLFIFVSPCTLSRWSVQYMIRWGWQPPLFSLRNFPCRICPRKGLAWDDEIPENLLKGL